MPVFQMELKWIDIDQVQSITLLFYSGSDLSQGLSRAASIAAAVQQFSELRLIDVRISLNVAATLTGDAPIASSRKRLTLWCEAAPDAVDGKRHRFKSILYGPKATLLDNSGIAFEPTTTESQSFISTVLNNTTDLRGNAFASVLRGVVTLLGA